jgi:apolipoprotein N-acyltransferase
MIDGKKILTLICLEDILSDQVRSDVLAGEPDLIVDLTSDAWFGRSNVPWLHLNLAKLRAIETRRYLIHATNTGVTAVVDPAGRVALQLPADQPAAGVAVAGLGGQHTLYERVGEGPWRCCLLLALGLAVRRRHVPTGERRALVVANGSGLE